MSIQNAMDYVFTDGHVQDDIFKDGHGFISSESIVIAVKVRDATSPYNESSLNGPDDLENFIAVGLVENATMAQQKNIQQLFEIGARDPYFIPGRTIVQAALNRVIFDGDSLLRVLYPTNENSGSDEAGSDGSAFPKYVEGAEWPNNEPGTNDRNKGDLWFNLSSEFFNKPFTMALVFYNDNSELVGYCVLEDCYVEAHNLAMAAAQTVVTENVRMRAKRVTSYGVGSGA